MINNPPNPSPEHPLQWMEDLVDYLKKSNADTERRLAIIEETLVDHEARLVALEP